MRLPSLEKDRWMLADAEARNASHPGTFDLPPRRIREILRPGDFAKLGFLILVEPPQGGKPRIALERLWVVVSDRAGDVYLGRLTAAPRLDDPAAAARLPLGCETPFGPEHVLDAMPKQDVKGDPLTELPPLTRRWQ